MAAKSQSIDWQSVLGDLLDSTCGIASDELSDLTQAIGKHSARAVRMHSSIDARQLPFESRPVPWFDRGRWLVDTACRPGAFLNYAAGDYYIQDAGSMLALALCDVKPGQSVCDTCAAPGGKSSGLLEQLGGSGVVVSNEVIRSRLDLLELTLARTGHANYLVTNCDVETLADRLGDSFDCVIVDAPCTGQSMVARGKQSLASFTLRQIEHSAARQQRILRAAQGLVKPGGRLVYSTCTFSFAENEGMIQWFLDEFREWMPISSPQLTEWENPDRKGCYRLWPHRDQCSGAFAAALVRSDSTFSVTPSVQDARLAGSTRSRNNGFSFIDVPARDLPWLQLSGAATIGLWQRGAELHYFPSEVEVNWIEAAHAGVPIAEFRGGEWQPSYAASLVELPNASPAWLFELDSRQAAEYMTGAAVRLNQRESPDAASRDSQWIGLTWRNRRLAWTKLAAGVLKNHLPKTLRKPQLVVAD